MSLPGPSKYHPTDQPKQEIFNSRGTSAFLNKGSILEKKISLGPGDYNPQLPKSPVHAPLLRSSSARFIYRNAGHDVAPGDYEPRQLESRANPGVMLNTTSKRMLETKSTNSLGPGHYTIPLSPSSGVSSSFKSARERFMDKLTSEGTVGPGQYDVGMVFLFFPHESSSKMGSSNISQCISI